MESGAKECRLITPAADTTFSDFFDWKGILCIFSSFELFRNSDTILEVILFEFKAISKTKWHNKTHSHTFKFKYVLSSHKSHWYSIHFYIYSCSRFYSGTETKRINSSHDRANQFHSRLTIYINQSAKNNVNDNMLISWQSQNQNFQRSLEFEINRIKRPIN